MLDILYRTIFQRVKQRLEVLFLMPLRLCWCLCGTSRSPCNIFEALSTGLKEIQVAFFIKLDWSCRCWPISMPWYRNQSVALRCRSIGWFLYDNNFGLYCLKVFSVFSSLINYLIDWRMSRKCEMMLIKRIDSNWKVCSSFSVLDAVWTLWNWCLTLLFLLLALYLSFQDNVIILWA